MGRQVGYRLGEALCLCQRGHERLGLACDLDLERVGQRLKPILSGAREAREQPQEERSGVDHPEQLLALVGSPEKAHRITGPDTAVHRQRGQRGQWK